MNTAIKTPVKKAIKRHIVVVSASRRPRDWFRRRFWVMCRNGDHEGPFSTRDEAFVASHKHRMKIR